MTRCCCCDAPATLLGDDVPEPIPAHHQAALHSSVTRMLGWRGAERVSTRPLCVRCADESWANVRLLAQEDNRCMTTA